MQDIGIDVLQVKSGLCSCATVRGADILHRTQAKPLAREFGDDRERPYPPPFPFITRGHFGLLLL